MPDEGLEQLVAKWAPVLGLAHWDISVRWAESGDLEGMGYADADVKFRPCAEKAAIRVKREEDCERLEGDGGYDAEESIVHELLHLVFAHFPDGEPDDLKTDLFDTGIDRVARVLVRLARREDRICQQK